VRALLVELMPLEHAPAHLRLAFHDAGTYDVNTHSSGANGSIRLPEELTRGANTGWGHACLELLGEAKTHYPQLSWADLIAVGAAAAIQKCGGPAIEVGLGRLDSPEPAPTNRLPGGFEGAPMLKRIFARMGLSTQDLVVLSGAHVLGHTQRQPFTPNPWRFSNDYFVQLIEKNGNPILSTDTALLHDPELRPFVERYAADEACFFEDFAAALKRLTWLGYAADRDAPASTTRFKPSASIVT
jgi:L-ascorbate peroxidase